MERFDRLRGTSVPPIHTLYDKVRYNLGGEVDKYTYVLAKPGCVMQKKCLYERGTTIS